MGAMWYVVRKLLNNCMAPWQYLGDLCGVNALQTPSSLSGCTPVASRSVVCGRRIPAIGCGFKAGTCLWWYGCNLARLPSQR
jgi:hypothetical protein